MSERPLPPQAVQRLATLAPEVVSRVGQAVERGIPADAELARLFREHREYGARDRRFLSDLVFSHFRWRGWTTSLAAAYGLDAALPHPAADALARNEGIAPEPAGALPLEEKAEAVARWLKQDTPPALERLVPDWLPGVLFEPGGHLARCVASFQQRPPTWLRFVSGREQLGLETLRSAGIEATPHPRIRSAVSVSGTSGLASLPKEAKAGFEVQDLASQCVGLACAPKPGERWLDLCAGSGGKALHLADLMKNQGEVVATDIRESALDELRRRVRRAHATCVHARAHIADRELFDGVLVDAPCSGIGTWSRNPDARWRTSEQVVTEKAADQGELLRQAARHVKPGGMLVYSVCTVTAAETVEVVDRFLAENSEFRLAPAPHPLTSSPTPGTFWIWPWDGPGDGMFVARVVRPV